MVWGFKIVLIAVANLVRLWRHLTAASAAIKSNSLDVLLKETESNRDQFLKGFQ